MKEDWTVSLILDTDSSVEFSVPKDTPVNYVAEEGVRRLFDEKHLECYNLSKIMVEARRKGQSKGHVCEVYASTRTVFLCREITPPEKLLGFTGS